VIHDRLTRFDELIGGHFHLHLVVNLAAGDTILDPIRAVAIETVYPVVDVFAIATLRFEHSTRLYSTVEAVAFRQFPKFRFREAKRDALVSCVLFV